MTNFWPIPGTAAYEQSKGIWTRGDKIAVMRSVTEGSRSSGIMVVYVGDSSTDLGCIMEADLGVCMRDENGMSEEAMGLKEVLDRVGIRQRSFDGFEMEDGCLEDGDRGVWVASDFWGIRRALFGVASS